MPSLVHVTLLITHQKCVALVVVYTCVGLTLFFFRGHSSEAIGGPSKKAMLSFKHFLAQQDDSIDEGEAIQLYQEYKSDFKRKQITDFFDEHKEEDW